MDLYYLLNSNYLGKKSLVEVSKSKEEIELLKSKLEAECYDTHQNEYLLVTEKNDSILGLKSSKLSSKRHFVGFVQTHPEIDAKRKGLIYG